MDGAWQHKPSRWTAQISGVIVVLVLVLGACANKPTRVTSGGASEPVAGVPDEIAKRPAEARHEPILRWAGRGSWLNSSRSQREAELEHRLAGRRHFARQAGNVRAHYDESFAHARRSLSDADLLTLIVLDDAVRDPKVVRELLVQTELDRLDKATEYGGVLDGRGATLYPPHAGERPGDHAFVASQTMMESSAEVLAHYHFHAQAEDNAEYAGPSAGDLEYAARFGRHCIVFTSVGRGRLNMDVYFPDGVVVDMGEILE